MVSVGPVEQKESRANTRPTFPCLDVSSINARVELASVVLASFALSSKRWLIYG